MALADTNPGLWNWLQQAPGNKQGAIDEDGYSARRPDLKANWDNNPEIQQVYNGDFSRYLSDDYFRASNGPTAYPQFATPGGAPPPAANTPPPTATPPPTNNPVLPPSTTTDGGNFVNDQTSAQTGNYNSTGTTNQQTTGKSSTTSHEVANTTGTQNEVGHTVTKNTVDTPFDIQSSVAKEIPMVQQSDAATNAWLQDFMQTGGTAFGSQLDQGIRSSLTGAQMTGAGDSARARSSGYAAAEVGRKNVDQRLASAAQLRGGTGLGALNQQVGNLYGGTSVADSNNTTTSNSQTVGDKTSNTMDFQQLLGTENQSGTAGGQGITHASGIVPESTPVQTSQGGCVVCTAYFYTGQMHPGAIRRAINWKGRHPKYETSLAGYMVYGPKLAKWVLDRPRFAKVFKPIARTILYEENRLAGVRLPFRLDAWFNHFVFDKVSLPFGIWAKSTHRKQGVHCSRIRALLQVTGLYINL